MEDSKETKKKSIIKIVWSAISAIVGLLLGTTL